MDGDGAVLADCGHLQEQQQEAVVQVVLEMKEAST